VTEADAEVDGLALDAPVDWGGLVVGPGEADF
jgi:hypothetical protein